MYTLIDLAYLSCWVLGLNSGHTWKPWLYKTVVSNEQTLNQIPVAYIFLRAFIVSMGNSWFHNWLAVYYTEIKDLPFPNICCTIKSVSCLVLKKKNLKYWRLFKTLLTLDIISQVCFIKLWFLHICVKDINSSTSSSKGSQWFTTKNTQCFIFTILIYFQHV